VDNRHAGRAFAEYDQRVLQALADYAAIAIENARLYARSEAQRIELETFLRETEDGVIVVGPDNRLILINPAASEAFGVSQPRVVGQSLDSVIFNAQARQLFDGQSRGGEIQLEDGRIFNVHVTPIANVGRALVMQDITHLKKLDRIKSEFVTAVSHDLRSPLTAILGYVDLIQRSGPVNEQQAEFVARVRQSVHAINALITDLLDLGRIEAGFDTQKEPTSLAAVARYAVEAFKPQADAKQQTLVVSLPEGLPRVFANTLRLRQMVANLLDNAIKYTPPSGEVRISAMADGDQLILMVSDAGIGIAPADQPYIFDKFYRASNVRVGYAGTGLGLSIVKSIVEAHGGRIWLDSKLNQGTTFTVVLPKHKE
jgi:two-component system NtrC family sensor kinase